MVSGKLMHANGHISLTLPLVSLACRIFCGLALFCNNIRQNFFTFGAIFKQSQKFSKCSFPRQRKYKTALAYVAILYIYTTFFGFRDTMMLHTAAFT